MKVWQVMSKARIEGNGHNEKAELFVESSHIKVLYGTMIDGELHLFGGVYGRVSDIPAFLGGEDVIRYEYRDGCHYIVI